MIKKIVAAALVAASLSGCAGSVGLSGVEAQIPGVVSGAEMSFVQVVIAKYQAMQMLKAAIDGMPLPQLAPLPVVVQPAPQPPVVVQPAPQPGPVVVVQPAPVPAPKPVPTVP